MGGFIIEILISLIVLIMFITSILLKPNIKKILLKSFIKFLNKFVGGDE